MNDRLRPVRRQGNLATALMILFAMIALPAVAWAGAMAAPQAIAGPLSIANVVQRAVRDMLAGTSSQTSEERQTSVAEAVRRSEQRERRETPTPLPVRAAPTVEPTPTRTPTPRPSPTPTTSGYDRQRLRAILGQALTSYADLPYNWAANVETAARLLNDQPIAPGGTLSFNAVLGPITTTRGFRTELSEELLWGPNTPGCVAGGVCQVSTTLFQAALLAGLEVAEVHQHQSWLPRYALGIGGRPGFDARVGPGADLRLRNNTGDYVRVEAWADGRTVGVVVYGVDPGWTVQLADATPTQVVPASATPVRREVDTLDAGQTYAVSSSSDGFTIAIGRTVVRQGRVVDRYQAVRRYEPLAPILVVGVRGATPTPTPTPSGAPAPSSTFRPEEYRLANGRIRVPNLVGLPEAEARRRVELVGLTNTYTNYQGPGDVPDPVVRSVPPGAVLSQRPAPNAEAQPGETVYIAVRKP